ncbi:MAG TPA: GGDEF domain-containing protein [Ramlibacter sp.]|nr:GGDEF domain-containing protein [Ramlibacter sp.]
MRIDPFDELKAQLEQGGLEPLLEYIRTLTVVLDGRGAPLGWNGAFEPLREPFRGCMAQPELRQAMQDALQSREPVRLHLELDGGDYECLLLAQADDRLLLFAEPQSLASATPLPSAADELDRLRSELDGIRAALDVKQKELQAVLAQAEEVSHTDALTYLPNRRSMIAELQRQVTFSERYSTPLSVSMIDVDNFKDINDTYGHAVGDQVLRYIASEMRDRIRQPDVIGRLGGDEFLVILPSSPSNAASEQARRLCQQIAGTPVIAGKEIITVSLSIGITQYQPNSDDWHTLLERADQAMYQAKRNGRGQWAILKA